MQELEWTWAAAGDGEEWSHHFKAFAAGASAEERNLLRDTSFALSNIMFFPMFKLIFELWEKYRRDGRDWHKSDEWRDGFTRLAGSTEIPGTKKGETRRVSIMARDFDGVPEKGIPAVVGNPEWQGKVLVETVDSKGKKSWSLSSTRQTREAAFYYLLDKSGLASFIRPAAKPKAA